MGEVNFDLFASTMKAKEILGHSQFDIVISPWYDGYSVRIRSFVDDLVTADIIRATQFETTYQEIISGHPDILNLRFDEALRDLVKHQKKE